jgi:hypothetical protein
VRKVFITHVTKEYLQVGLNLAKSLQEFSPTPLIVYFVGEEQPELDLFAEFPNASVRFIPMELEKFASGNDYSFANGGNFYVNRYSTKIYHILAAKTIAMEMALQEGWDQVCYLDSDCIATPLVDELFNWCDLIEDYPIATAGIHEYMIMIENGFQRGNPFLNSWPEPDNKLALEWPLMSFLEMSEWSRGNYRTTGIMLMNQKCRDFVTTWKEFCFVLPKLVDLNKYAAYHEETVYNVLHWKKTNIGFPLCYINLREGFETVKYFYSDQSKPGEYTFDDSQQDPSKNFFRIPEDKRLIKVLHGEKRKEVVEQIIEHVKSLQKNGSFDK